MSTIVLSPIGGGLNVHPSNIRRRNALIPLPLLPPVPRNAIVTSVKIVHNPPSPTDSSSSPEEDEVRITNVTSTERKSIKRPSTSPTSPTQPNCYFAPLAKRPRHRRRSSSRCSPPTSPTSPPGNRPYFPVIPESIKPVVPKEKETIASLKRPRSTILVTVRLISPPAQSTDTFDSLPPPPPPSSLPPTPSLRHKKPLSIRKPRLSIQNLSNPRMKSPPINAHIPPLPLPLPIKPKWNKPRVSSNLATNTPILAHFENLDMDMDPFMSSLYPAGYTLRNPSSHRPMVTLKKGKKAKTGSRIGMLRWAVLNHSGPEIGRRIQSMGVRLAKEIWEAERFVEEEEEVVLLGCGKREMNVTREDVREDENEFKEDDMPLRDLEEMEIDEMVEPSLDRKMINTILENTKEGRALLEEEEEEADDMTAKAETSIEENTNIMEEDFDSKIPSPTNLSFGRRASLATDKLNYSHDKLNGINMKRRSSLGLTEDKIPIIMAARKWFGKVVL